MRNDLALLRRLERIEKEIGYCDVKLEKERRLLAQVRLLRIHQQAVEEAIAVLRALPDRNDCDGNRLGGLHLSEVPAVLVRGGSAAAGQGERMRAQFRRLGALWLLEEELAAVAHEVEDRLERLDSFQAFHVKRRRLFRQRTRALDRFQGNTSVIAMAAEFDRTEESWNTLTEDLMNADEAAFFMSRAAEYLTSSRGFVLAARSQFSVSHWLKSGYVIDLFKHSAIARANEMVVGAERNLKHSLIELVCLDELAIPALDMDPVLLPFLDALFDDLFLAGRLTGTLALLDQRLAGLRRITHGLDQHRESVSRRQQDQEQNRGRLYSEMGSARRKLTQAMGA